VTCAHCKRKLQMHRRHPHEPFRLQCRGQHDERDCPGVGTPTVDQVCEALLAKIEAEYATDTVDMAARQAARRAEVSRASVDAGRLRRELAKVEQAMSSTTADMYRGLTTEAEHQGAMAILREEAEQLRARLAEVEQIREAPKPPQAAKLARELRGRWGTMSAAEKNRVLKSLVRKASVRRAECYREPVADRMVIDLW